jgi:hypothetical protein
MDNGEIEKQIAGWMEMDESHLPATGSADERFKAFRDLLRLRIEELAERDMEKLMWILYRIDVSEKKLNQTLKETPPENFSSVIADLIIERQIQKINTRRQFGEKETEWNFDI